MSLLVRAFPLKAPVSDLQKFTEVLKGERKEQLEAFYEAYGVTHESWYLQHTEQGPLVIGLTQLLDAHAAAPQYAQAQEGFARWFKDQIKALSGVDPDLAPLGPPTELVFEWSDSEETARQFCAP
jgi:hypothetical protein